MKKLKDWTEMVIGRVYNSVYVGGNKAYAKINGKETLLVLGKDPFQYAVLFSNSGDPFTTDIREGPITSTFLEGRFKDCEIFEPDDDSEWFRKSVRVGSIVEALRQRFITVQQLKELCLDSRFFIPRFDQSNELMGVVGSFGVEGRTTSPLLQSVFVVWKTWQNLYSDFAEAGVEIRS